MDAVKKLSIGLWLALVVPFLSAEDVQIQSIGPFGTLNNFDNPLVIPSNKAQDLLNVEITPNGISVKKREGYAEAFSLPVSTSPTHGVYKFYDSSGDEVVLAFHDKYLSSSINGQQFTTLFSTGPDGASYQCIDSQGFAYCANSTRNNIIRTDGVTYVEAPGISDAGSLVAVSPDRLILAGFSSDSNRIDFSESANFSNFAPPFSAGTDPNQITITAPGSRISHITYAFNRLIWFKDNSFGYVLVGPDLASWQIRTISPTVGTLDNSSIYWNDLLYWKGQDGHFYSYDGSNISRMSRDIGGTVAMLQSRASNSWSQTSLSDFQMGVSTPTGYINLNITQNSISLDTATAISPFVDTNASDFAQGTLTSLSSTTIDGSLTLSLGSELVVSSATLNSNSGACTSCGPNSKLFLSTASASLSRVLLRLVKVGSPGNYTIRLLSDNSGSPGSVIVSSSIPSSLVTTSTSNVSINMPMAQLAAGTSYWIQIQSSGTCNTSNYIAWIGLGFIGSSSFNLCGGAGGSTFFGLGVLGNPFSSSGDIVSRIFDVGFTTNTWIWEFRELDTVQSSTSSTTLSYETQTSSSSTGVFTSLVSVSTGGIISSPAQQFIRYKASFSTTDPSTSPVLSEIEINISTRIRPSATFYSQINNAPNLTSWNSFVSHTNGNGNYSYFVRSATQSITILSSSPSFVAINNGAIPAIAVSTYMQVQIVIVATSPFAPPRIDDFSMNWYEGLAADKTYAGYFEYALWWNVQIGTSNAYNNYVVRYDLINNGFVIYDIPMNGFYIRQNEMYFGSSNSGQIYKFGGMDSDNGSAINSYWKSKDFIPPGSPFNDTEYTRLSILASSVQNSSMTLTYTLSGSSSTSYNFSLYDPRKSYKERRQNLNMGSIGNTLSVQFGNNAADQPFEVFALEYGFREKPWRPGD